MGFAGGWREASRQASTAEVMQTQGSCSQYSDKFASWGAAEKAQRFSCRAAEMHPKPRSCWELQPLSQSRARCWTGTCMSPAPQTLQPEGLGQLLVKSGEGCYMQNSHNFPLKK